MLDQHEYQPITSFRFDNFVVGNSNRFAFAACKSVAQSPGTIYNPLFIYGGVGLGKTHLLCGVGNFVRSNDPDAKVIYITIEQLTKELMTAVENGTVDAFNDQFRTVDCILIDDVGLLKAKESIQQEIVHFFDVLVSRKKQIALTSDRPPRELTTLLERLRSRLEGGLIVDIQAPEFETRVAILQQKVEQEQIKDISDEVVYAIAERIKTNIRELEGAFNKLIAFSAMTNERINVNHLPQIFREQPEDMDDEDGMASPGPAKKAPPKQPREDETGGDTDVFDFIEDMADDVTESIAKKEAEMVEKEKFRRKIYIWQMKGFNTSRLEKILNEEMDVIREVFNEYTRDVNKLIKTQKNIACMDNTEGFTQELRELEDLLFDPDRIVEIDRRLNYINERIEKRFEYRETIQRDVNVNDFIVSDSNRLAFSMAESIIAHPAERFNPLFLHGPEDTGKTFLLHGIGNEVFRKHPPAYVCYVHAKQFISQLIEAIKEGSVSEFVNYYRSVDFLLFDDIHLLRGKERTQEEFFHIFNSLMANNRQIVITSDRPPQYLLTFDERLRSRFKSGLVVEIGAMDLNAKKQAIQSLFNRCNLTISDDLIDSIVEGTSNNLKEISNVIEQTLVQSAASGETVTEEMIRSLLQEEAQPTPAAPMLQEDPTASASRMTRITKAEIDKKLITDWPAMEDLLEMEY